MSTKSVQPTSTVVAVLIPVVLLMASAAVAFYVGWTWWRNGETVSVTVTSTSSNSGDTVYQVDYDGVRAHVDLHAGHKIGDVVEVLFDPSNAHPFKPESEVLSYFGLGLILFLLGVGLVSCLVMERRRVPSRSVPVSVGASTSGSR